MVQYLQVDCDGPHEYTEVTETISEGPGGSIIASHWICRKCGHPLNDTAKNKAEEVARQIKGEFNGLCNRKSCQKPGAIYYNYVTEKYYCEACADLINLANKKDAMEMLGHDLCILKTSHEH